MNPSNSERVSVIDPAVIAHMLDHPARGRRWSVRELAVVTGRSPALIGHIRSGRRRQVDPELARLLSDAVGCHMASLFTLASSTFVDNSTETAAS